VREGFRPLECLSENITGITGKGVGKLTLTRMGTYSKFYSEKKWGIEKRRGIFHRKKIDHRLEK